MKSRFSRFLAAVHYLQIGLGIFSRQPRIDARLRSPPKCHGQRTQRDHPTLGILLVGNASASGHESRDQLGDWPWPDKERGYSPYINRRGGGIYP